MPDWTDLSGGVFALLGALVGGAFTARAATSASRLQARADGFEVWTEVQRRWNELTSIEAEDWDSAGSVRAHHQAQRRIMFLAGVPLDVYDVVRAGELLFVAYQWRGEDLPLAAWFHLSWHQRLVDDYLEHPWRARLLRRSPRLMLVRYRWKRGRFAFEVPAC